MYHDGLEWTRCFCRLNFRSYQFRRLRRSGCKSWPPNAEAPTLAPVANQLFANCEPCLSAKQAMNCEDLWNSGTGIRFCMVLQYYAILRIENCLVISSRWLRVVIFQAMIKIFSLSEHISLIAHSWFWIHDVAWCCHSCWKRSPFRRLSLSWFLLRGSGLCLKVPKVKCKA